MFPRLTISHHVPSCSCEELHWRDPSIGLKNCCRGREGGREGGKLTYHVSCKGISQEEQNGANFSFVAPSSEELRVRIHASHCKW